MSWVLKRDGSFRAPKTYLKNDGSFRAPKTYLKNDSPLMINLQVTSIDSILVTSRLLEIRLTSLTSCL